MQILLLLQVGTSSRYYLPTYLQFVVATATYVLVLRIIEAPLEIDT